MPNADFDAMIGGIGSTCKIGAKLAAVELPSLV